MKTRGRKILKDVLSRRGRTLLVAASIMIGVFGAVTLISTNDLIISQLNEDIVPDEVAMVRVFVTVPSAATDTRTDAGEDQVLDFVRASRDTGRAIPGLADVRQIEGQRLAPAFWKPASGDTFKESNVMAFSEPFDSIQLEPPKLVEGDWPQPGQNEVAIEQRMAIDEDLAVGDTIEFRPLGEIGGGEWTITGIAYHAYWVDPGDGGENEPERRIFVTSEDSEFLTGISSFTSFYLRYVDTDAAWRQVDRLQETIADETAYIPQFAWTDDPDDYFLIGNVQEVTAMLDTLAIVALVVSGFLVTNVINTIVVEQKRQIGVMKSLGATRMDNFTIYAGVALVYGIIGTIPGVLLGIVAGSAMAGQVARLAFTLIEGFNVSMMGVIIGAVMGLLVPVVAALIPVFNGTRVTIMDAMTDLGIAGDYGRGPLARIIKLLPVPVAVRQALSNVIQKKGRLLLTVITLTLAAAAFMGVFAMFTVITQEIDNLFSTFNYEISVSPREPQDFETTRDLILATDGVDDVYPGVGFAIQILDLNGTAIVIGPQQDQDIPTLGVDPATNTLDLTYTDGSGWTDDPARDGVVITSAVANELDREVGDTLLVAAGGRTGEYELIGVISYPFPFVMMRWQELSTLAGFVTPDGAPLPVLFFITVESSDPSVDDVNAVIDNLSERLSDAGIVAAFDNQVQVQEDVATQMLTFNLIFQLTSAVMAAVGAIGLLTTLSMAVFERQKEIGVMRSIGAGSGTIITQFLVEGILIGLLAWALAVPLSFALAQVLLNGLGFADFIEFVYPVWVLGLGLVGMIIVAALASLWPSLTAARRTVSDILRYQ